MDLEIITIGTELLLGFTIDTNAAHLARALASVGARVVRRTTVADRAEDIEEAVRSALSRTGFVITTGGLGPTRDDVTKRVVAEIFRRPLRLDRAYLAELEERFAKLGRKPMPEANRSQAEIPEGAVVLPNRWGTAPGLWLEGEPGTAVLLPGVPREMQGLLEHELLPRLKEKLSPFQTGLTVIRSRTLRTTGIPEAALADRIGDLEPELAPVTLAYLPGIEGVDLRLTAWNLPPEEAESVLQRAADLLRPRLGIHFYGEEGEDLAGVVLSLLKGRSCKLAVAESCTGGLLGERITAIPGSSAVFLGGVVAYSDEAKIRDLDVPRQLLVAHGAVSEPVALAMARGAARRFGAGASLAITGIAGPGGGTPEKPVGTVWLAACLDGAERTAKLSLTGERDDIRRRSAQAALNLLRKMLLGQS
ncbi:CinA-like protein [bacterium HR33]|nr:CinA-like protein [bacterium HR33]